MGPFCRRMLDTFLNMHALSWWIFIRAMRLSCMLLFCAALLLLAASPVGADTFFLFRAGQAFTELPQLILLFGILGIAVAEDHFNGT